MRCNIAVFFSKREYNGDLGLKLLLIYSGLIVCNAEEDEDNRDADDRDDDDRDDDDGDEDDVDDDSDMDTRESDKRLFILKLTCRLIW